MFVIKTDLEVRALSKRSNHTTIKVYFYTYKKVKK